MLQRSITLTVWALVGWTAMVLGLRLLPQPLQAPAGAQALAAEAPAPASLVRLFGAAPVAVEAVVATPGQERFRLIGVVAPRQAQLQSSQGVALLSIDGGPPKAFRVGQRVDGHLRLLSVSANSIGLGEGIEVQMQLQLQSPSPASTGSLPLAPSLAANPLNAPPPSQGGPQSGFPGAAQTGPMPPQQQQLPPALVPGQRRDNELHQIR